MLRGRVASLERRLAGLGGPTEKKLREVIVFADDPEPQAAPDEQLLVIRVIHTRDERHTPPAMKATAPTGDGK
jgi:hypothetical protein